MKEIQDFLDKYVQDWGEDGIVNFNYDSLSELLAAFQKQDAWKFDTKAMAETLFCETQETKRLASFIKHEREQRRFIAANSAMNGILANSKTADYLGSLKESVRHEYVAEACVSIADALLAELKSSNQSTPQP